MTLQSFYRSIMALEYQIHLPEYLAKCINKDVPSLQCNGQCALMQKIAEKEKEETEKNLVVYEYSSLYMNNDLTVFTMERLNIESNQNHFSDYQTDYTFTYYTSIFHPPLS